SQLPAYLRWSEQQGTGFSHANSGMKIPHPALGKKFCTSGEFRLAKNNFLPKPISKIRKKKQAS
ncbi:hypothetical protein KO465_07690, partial [Candidatus Micrarchaeota archaeon]|nr:hypothetical protein [Candidatus Micrarchaeota archaeon]